MRGGTEKRDPPALNGQVVVELSGHAGLPRKSLDRALEGAKYAPLLAGLGDQAAVVPENSRHWSFTAWSGTAITPQLFHEVDWASIRSLTLQRLIRTLRVPHEWLEDAVQDALVCMVILGKDSKQIDNSVAFGVAFVRKRWVEELRKRGRRGEELKADLSEEADGSAYKHGTLDWSALLRGAGWEPTDAWSHILGAIASGARGTNKIAQRLGRSVKTIHESRKRLQRWLREKTDRPPAP